MFNAPIDSSNSSNDNIREINKKNKLIPKAISAKGKMEIKIKIMLKTQSAKLSIAKIWEYLIIFSLNLKFLI